MAVNAGILINAAIENGMIEAETVARLQVRARRERLDLLSLVTHQGRFPISALYQALAGMRGLPFLEGRELKADRQLLARIPEALMQRHDLLPVGERDGEVLVATANPDDRAALDLLRRTFGRAVRLALADPDAIEAALRQLRPAPRGVNTMDRTEGEIDSVAVLDRIFTQAYLCRASDIHLVPHKEGMRLRLRVDGRLQDYPGGFSGADGLSLVSRIKVLAGLDIAEQREPQDGGMVYHLPPPADRDMDVRVATVPTRLGERVTLRLLGQDTQDLGLAELGMSQQNLHRFRTAIERPYGMILLTGPTGSGKSTTLYAALREINRPDLNIMTVEDPVEYQVAGLSQIQVNSKVSFAGALRSLLRHDPDILMLGEIRDAETADVALKAAMTGHLVFSTLHTNDAVSAVSRLADIGAERFLIASTLVAVIAQRLVRRLCPRCRTAHAASEEERALLGREGQAVELFEASGCPYCLGSGYRGRIGLFETLWLDRQLAGLIASGAGEAELTATAAELTTLWADGCEKVLTGQTSLAELKRVAVVQE